MISYELAKKLKDAGFPQAGAGGRIADPAKIVGRREDFAYAPTLSELIIACADGFYSLDRGLNEEEWRAWGVDASGNVKDLESGRTPEEAVTLLWLALTGEGTTAAR